MTGTPVEELAETFVELADTLVDEFDLGAFLNLVAGRCVRLLDVAAAGLLLPDHAGRAQAIGASDDRTARLCRLDGPLLECCRSGEPIPEVGLPSAGRWPEFAAAATRLGFATAHTLPLRLRDEVLGALCVFRTVPGDLGEVSTRVAKALADLAAIVLVQARSLRRQADLAAQLQHALTSRVVIEQAKGIVAARLGLGVDAAFSALRKHARSSNSRITDIATAVVAGEFEVDRLRWQ